MTYGNGVRDDTQQLRDIQELIARLEGGQPEAGAADPGHGGDARLLELGSAEAASA